MSNQDAGQIKHRPVLSTRQLVTILQVLKAATYSDDVVDVLQYLEPYLFKVQMGVKPAAYVTTTVPRETLEDSLGLLMEAVSSSYQMQQFTTAQAAAYSRWQLAPEACNPEELELVTEYRMHQGLMTDAEMQEILMAALDKQLAVATTTATVNS